uniref:GTPase family protein n=1 Tax=Actinotalea sp. C106 TaxID=2908644 RepID=UPI0020276FA2
MAVSLVERLDSLAVAVRAGREVLPAEVLAQVQAVEARAGQRMRLSDQHTVVAFAGSTGSGKSSLVNAVTGTDLAPVGVLRPTTAEPLAMVRGPEGAGPLLDWLGVRRRHHLDRPVADHGTPPSSRPPSSRPEALDLATDGLVVLDLPDHDSVVVAHRTEAERLVSLVDLMVWVVDPQKYADAAVHERYLRGLAGHAAVVVVVLNQVDRLAAEEVEACRQDLRRLLEEDGLGSARLLTTSARTGEGVADLVALLDEAARRREAAQHRLEAEVTAAASAVLEQCGDQRPTDAPAATELVASLEHAAGVPQVVAAVRGSWLLEGRLATS